MCTSIICMYAYTHIHTRILLAKFSPTNKLLLYIKIMHISNHNI